MKTRRFFRWNQHRRRRSFSPPRSKEKAPAPPRIPAGELRQGITKHLRVLAGAGIVRGTRHGRESRWKLERKQLDVATHYLESISRRWDSALERLKTFVEE
jgi:hypothetical protein